MASKETWDKVKKYFRPDSKIDNWGDAKKISDEVVLRLYDFRVWLNIPIYVTAGVATSGHSKNSFHYEVMGACAVDVVIPDYEHSPFDLVLDATRFGFHGIGYYPHWQFHGKTTGGLHLDTRPLKWDLDGSVNYSHSRWMGVLQGQKQEYIALTFQNLLTYAKSLDSIEGLH